jgi:N-acetylmuramoyl-L-alanine amidase
MLSAAIICLSLNIFFEARGESLKGQYAVAFVTMNRVGDESNDPSKVCKTVFESEQFSWTSDYKKPIKRYMKIAQLAKKKDEESWNKAKEVAEKVLSKKVKDVTNGATFFNERKMGRRFKTKTATRVIGGHIFY